MTVRPPAALKAEAQAVLNARELEVRAFVVACLTALVADPDRVIDELGEHWPEKKPRGRPPRTSAE
ncbi:hypothetical protein ACWGCC_30485 [Streptomyces nigrescens]